MTIQLALIYGGIDGEREVSLKAHEYMQQILSTTDFDIHSIEISESGEWLRDGKKIEPARALEWADYAWITGAGAFMEDGRLQKILEQHQVPYNGSDALSSRICFSKTATKDLFEKKGIKTPTWDAYDLSKHKADQLANDIFQTFPQPCVIKPDRGGSSLGVHIANDYKTIKQALEELKANGYNEIVIEECITGCEATVGVVEDLRDTDYYTLPPVEIVPQGEFFDYQAKYAGESEEICPARFEKELSKNLEQIALEVHRDLELDDYSRTDFVIHPERGIFALEVNTLPGMTEASLLPKELEAVGVELKEFYQHIINRKLGKI